MTPRAATLNSKAGLYQAINNSHRRLRPPPKRTVCEWACENRYLSAESAAEPGLYRVNRAKYQQGWQDAVTEPGVREIVLMKSAQVGGTDTLLGNVAAYFIAHDPAPILMIHPTLEMAQAYSKDRFAPMIRDSPMLRGLISEPRSKDSGNTILHKTFPAGNITMVGANAPAALSSRPKRIVLNTEPDRSPASAGMEGDPYKLGLKRTTTYSNSLGIMEGTPTIKGASRVEAQYELSDKRKYYVPCPVCDFMQVLDWARLQWFKDTAKRGRILTPHPGEEYEHLPDTAFYECESCDHRMQEHDRLRMILKGEWRATAKFTRIAGFWINELYSPWVLWSDITRNFLEAKKQPETLKVFNNTSLGVSWEEKGDSVDEEPLLNRRESYPAEAPDGVLVITLAVDVQDNRLELEYKGWGIGEECWGLGYHKLHGDPGRDELWNQLDDYLKKTFIHESGITLHVVSTAIDSGGHYTQAVYDYCKKKQKKAQRVYAIKGSSVRGKPIVGKETTAGKQKVKLYVLGTDTAKELIYGRIAIDQPGPGYYHFPLDYDEDYFKGLTSEQCITRWKQGVPIRSWVKKLGRKANEPLDITVYNHAALKILNPVLEVLGRKLKKKIEKQKKEKEEVVELEKDEPPKRKKKKGDHRKNKSWATNW